MKGCAQGFSTSEAAQSTGSYKTYENKRNQNLTSGT